MEALNPKKILLIRIRAFGDTILTTPTLRSLKKAYPQAKVTVLVEPGMAMVLKGLPYIHEIWTWDRQASKQGGWWAELKANLALWKEVRARRFDLVLDVLGTTRTAWITWISGAATRVGFAFRIRRWAYNIVWKPAEERKYIADYTADLLRAIGLQPDSLKTDFYISPMARQKAGEFINSLGLGEAPLMVMAAGGWELKRYPEAQLAEAVRQVLNASPRHLVYLWGPGEEGMAQSLKDLVGQGVLAPATDFEAMAALLERAACLLTNDNATKHLAVARECPTVTVFGPTSDIAWHPPKHPKHLSVRLDLPCSPCEALSCHLGTHACMRDLRPEQVSQAVLSLLPVPA